MKFNCRFCNSPIQHSFCDLGLSPLANSYIATPNCELPLSPLHAYVCAKCFLVQLPNLHTPSEIFKEYAYFSSYSSSWLQHAEKYVYNITERLDLHKNSQVIEIASNDGYLLQYFQKLAIPAMGIEPAENVAQVALKKGIPTHTAFFGRNTAEQFRAQADLVIANNVLAHVPDLNDFVAGLKILLKPQGVITLEFPHLLKLIEETQFDTIYHEHFSYLSLSTVNKICNAHALSIFDVEHLETHGGSLRVYLKHTEDLSKEIEKSVPILLKEEAKKGLLSLSIYTDFSTKVAAIKSSFLKFLETTTAQGKTVVAYGAPAKGNTFLNFLGITSSLLPYTVDLSPHKQNKYLPGSLLPIYSPRKIQETQPDYILILPWNLKKEIVEQMQHVRSWGGKFVTAIPQLVID